MSSDGNSCGNRDAYPMRSRGIEDRVEVLATSRAAKRSTAGDDGARVLVAYASKYGSTRGIAERIAGVLRSGGHDVTLSSADEGAEASAYDAVVIGSPVFNQRWLPESERFVQRNYEALRSRPVWLFSVGTFGDRKRFIGPLMRREPRGIRTLRHDIHARGYRVFAGVIDRRQWPPLSRLFYHALGGRLGDNREWLSIDEWSDGIARALRGGDGGT